jgi:hypothetical protein
LEWTKKQATVEVGCANLDQEEIGVPWDAGASRRDRSVTIDANHVKELETVVLSVYLSEE